MSVTLFCNQFSIKKKNKLCPLIVKSNCFFVINDQMNNICFGRLSPFPAALCLCVLVGGGPRERHPQTDLAPVAPAPTERSMFLQDGTIDNTPRFTILSG